MESKTSEQTKSKWYENKALVIVLLGIFFPVGLYAMWKNKNFSDKTKWIVTGIFASFVLAGVISDKKSESESIQVTTTHSNNNDSSTSERTAKSVEPKPNWWEGGTLHKTSALEWQTASSTDKLATCADFVTTMWQNGDLKPSIVNQLSSVDDVRPYAQELVDFLDAAFKRDPDPEQNRKLFTNQTVSSTAAIGMVTMGWTK